MRGPRTRGLRSDTALRLHKALMPLYLKEACPSPPFGTRADLLDGVEDDGRHGLMRGRSAPPTAVPAAPPAPLEQPSFVLVEIVLPSLQPCFGMQPGIAERPDWLGEDAADDVVDHDQVGVFAGMLLLESVAVSHSLVEDGFPTLAVAAVLSCRPLGAALGGMVNIGHDETSPSLWQAPGRRWRVGLARSGEHAPGPSWDQYERPTAPSPRSGRRRYRRPARRAPGGALLCPAPAKAAYASCSRARRGRAGPSGATRCRGWRRPSDRVSLNRSLVAGRRVETGRESGATRDLLQCLSSMLRERSARVSFSTYSAQARRKRMWIKRSFMVDDPY